LCEKSEKKGIEGISKKCGINDATPFIRQWRAWYVF